MPSPQSPQIQRGKKPSTSYFRPGGDTSSTRKGWRLYAFVSEPAGPEPILASAFLAYDKDQAPKKNHEKFVAEKLVKFLQKVREIEATPDRFRRQDLHDGRVVSMCYECGATLFSTDHNDADFTESGHECQSKL